MSITNKRQITDVVFKCAVTNPHYRVIGEYGKDIE